MSAKMEILKKIKSVPSRIENVAMNLVDGFIPKVAHKLAVKAGVPEIAERVAGYGASVGVSTAAMMVGFFGGIVAPLAAMTAFVLGAPVVGAVAAAAIPVGAVAALAGMAMSESTALADGYFGYADMHKMTFKDDKTPRKTWSLNKITGLFARAAKPSTKVPAADQSPQNHPPAPPSAPQPT